MFYYNPILITSGTVFGGQVRGTGIEQDQFNIFQINLKGLDNIWNAISYEKSFPLGIAKDQNYELKGSLQFDDLNNDGTEELIYTIRHMFYSFDTKTQKLLPLKKEKTTRVFKFDRAQYIYIGPLEE